MRIFIDESGTFSGFQANSVSVVGALVIPDVMLGNIEKKYAKFRDKLPKENGEVKGRLLNERQVDKVVTLLIRNEALFEITAVDLGLHQESAVRDYKQKLGEQMLAKVANFREDLRPEVQAASEYILQAPLNLFLQALTTFNVLHRVISRSTTFSRNGSRMNLAPFRGSWTGKNRPRSPDGRNGGRTTHKARLRACQKGDRLGCCPKPLMPITRSMKNSIP